eukprot:4459601-Pyramimonas_sp.AAC.1
MSLRHLTPLRVACALPPGCPSRRPPLYYVLCLWLRPRQLAEICESAEAAWAESCAGSGTVGVYTLAEHVRAAAAAALGDPPQVTQMSRVYAADQL